MATPIQKTIETSIQSAEGLYHRLVLLVGVSQSGKTDVLRGAAEAFGTTVINVNLALSKELLELTVKQRSLRLPEILGQIVDKNQSPIVLDNIEILFDKELKQDPLRLLQGISRNRTVLSSWNGAYAKGQLSYAEIGHPEYRIYDSLDVLVVSMGGVTKTDTEKNN